MHPNECLPLGKQSPVILPGLVTSLHCCDVIPYYWPRRTGAKIPSTLFWYLRIARAILGNPWQLLNGLKSLLPISVILWLLKGVGKLLKTKNKRCSPPLHHSECRNVFQAQSPQMSCRYVPTHCWSHVPLSFPRPQQSVGNKSRKTGPNDWWSRQCQTRASRLLAGRRGVISLALFCKPYILTYIKDARIHEGNRKTITSHRRRVRTFASVRAICTVRYWWRKWRHTWKPEAVVYKRLPRMHPHKKHFRLRAPAMSLFCGTQHIANSSASCRTVRSACTTYAREGDWLNSSAPCGLLAG